MTRLMYVKPEGEVDVVQTQVRQIVDVCSVLRERHESLPGLWVRWTGMVLSGDADAKWDMDYALGACRNGSTPEPDNMRTHEAAAFHRLLLETGGHDRSGRAAPA